MIFLYIVLDKQSLVHNDQAFKCVETLHTEKECFYMKKYIGLRTVHVKDIPIFHTSTLTLSRETITFFPNSQ